MKFFHGFLGRPKLESPGDVESWGDGTICLPNKLAEFWEKKQNTLETSTENLVQNTFRIHSQDVLGMFLAEPESISYSDCVFFLVVAFAS